MVPVTGFYLDRKVLWPVFSKDCLCVASFSTSWFWARHYPYHHGNRTVKSSANPKVAQVGNDFIKMQTLVWLQGLRSEPLCLCSCWFYENHLWKTKPKFFISEAPLSSCRLPGLSNCHPQTTVEGQQAKHDLSIIGVVTEAKRGCDFPRATELITEKPWTRIMLSWL